MTNNRTDGSRIAEMAIALVAIDDTLDSLQHRHQRSCELVEEQNQDLNRLQRNQVRLTDSLGRIEVELKALRQAIKPLLDEKN